MPLTALEYKRSETIREGPRCILTQEADAVEYLKLPKEEPQSEGYAGQTRSSGCSSRRISSDPYSYRSPGVIDAGGQILKELVVLERSWACATACGDSLTVPEP